MKHLTCRVAGQKRCVATLLVTSVALVEDQLAKGVSIEAQPIKRAISTAPVVKPIKVTAPNSVFALGSTLAKTGP